MIWFIEWYDEELHVHVYAIMELYHTSMKYCNLIGPFAGGLFHVLPREHLLYPPRKPITPAANTYYTPREHLSHRSTE